ncbi:MAG: class I SAM-dependent RNA methyltransferase, partial [Lachnospiraceae bacterium]|nr:class I SAM-dependent RNA methyltransferase [Lachnospiraceae bacterium]
MKKNDLVTVTVTDYTQDGEGVGKAGTFPLFIRDTVVGDTVVCKVMKLKSAYGYARLMEVVTPSPDRAAPVCPVYRACGGCQLQAVSYGGQLAFKENRVRQALARIGGVEVPDEAEVPAECVALQDGAEAPAACMALQDRAEAPAECVAHPDGAVGPAGARNTPESPVFYRILGMEQPLRYRNKAQVPVGTGRDGRPEAGFYADHSHDLVPMEDCVLAFPEAADVIRAVK